MAWGAILADCSKRGQALETFYRESGYVGPRPIRTARGQRQEKGFPPIHIHEGPHLTVKFLGNKELNDTELNDVLTFKESGAFDETNGSQP